MNNFFRMRPGILVAFTALILMALSAGFWISNEGELKESNKRKLLSRLAADNLKDKLKKNESPELLLEDISSTYQIPAIAICDSSKRVLLKHGDFLNLSSCNIPSHRTYPSLSINSRKITLKELPNAHTLLFGFDKASSQSFALKAFNFFAVTLSLLVVFGAILTWVLTRITRQTSIDLVQMLIRNRGKAGPLREQLSKEFFPVLKEVRTLVRELESDKKLRESSNIVWDSDSLKEVLTSRLKGDQVLVAANRQPYIHNYSNDKKNNIEVQTPASGLVTALEPVLRACSGIWFAHGSGSADKEVVDSEDKVWVPPNQKLYQIKRIWLSEEEEKGFYYGFSNEGLWPLCHIAHIRPVFRFQDFQTYKSVNQRFADAIVSEAHREDPIILVQDYHFALLPRMIREQLPKATIITFWHIPWSNSEKFGICPWVEEILDGLLGSSIIGFHTKHHCQNFLETVDRFCESRIDWGRSTISYKGELSAVRRYPISIEFPPKALSEVQDVATCVQNVRSRHKIGPEIHIGLGIERLDYTKGIIERFLAIERFLELYPSWIGKFTFIQIAAPSRSTIASYKQFHDEVIALVDRINDRFRNSNVAPIQLLIKHHSQPEVVEYFRAAKLCMVMSLHDGMNLVAKEFVASREDNKGSLILSVFAGAAREFPQAFIVNPYDIEHTAETIRSALELETEEERQRMQSMREHVRENNVYKWAGNMLLDAVKLRDRNRLLERVSEVDERPGYWQ